MTRKPIELTSSVYYWWGQYYWTVKHADSGNIQGGGKENSREAARAAAENFIKACVEVESNQP